MTARCAPFYRDVLERLTAEGVPFLVGGAYALAHYTGIVRDTKDLDLFVLPGDEARVLAVLAAAGYATELTDPVWLAKARCGQDFVDVVFSSGNGVARVDADWLLHAVPGDVLGVAVGICPPEETIWSKAFIMERERFDGADVAHLVRSCGRALDWRRLLERFGDHWLVLTSHLALFDFVYPDDGDAVPAWVRRDLAARWERTPGDDPPGRRRCRGRLLSNQQYDVDLERWGYEDTPGTRRP
jgi:hypothetical protein